MIPTREQAWALLCEYTKTPALRTHALTVEGVMRHFAGLYGGDVELWGVCGLLHDIDYEQWPNEHCTRCRQLLADAGVDDSLIRAVASHGWSICSEVEPVSDMEKVLFAVDELTGLITAAAIMRPSRSVMDLELKSVKKKYKSKGFADGVDRGVIEKGCQRIGLSLDEVIEGCILGMRTVAGEIGLLGNPQET